MLTKINKRTVSYIVFCCSLIVVTVVFGIRAKYSPTVYYFISSIQFIVVCVSAWNVGVWAVKTDATERRKIAAAGTLLVAPWALFSFLPGIGPPGDQTPAENQLRYLILLINTGAVTGGLIVLKEALNEAGEKFYSTLGFAAGILATPLYLIWAVVMLATYRLLELDMSSEATAWVKWVSDPSDILLFFGGALTYLATAAFVMSLEQIQWLGWRSSRGLVTACILALIFLTIRGLHFSDPSMLVHWYSIPGYVAGIPAIPWIIPCFVGVILLRRAGTSRGH